jgi:excisionase family DNA binding protein
MTAPRPTPEPVGHRDAGRLGSVPEARPAARLPIPAEHFLHRDHHGRLVVVVPPPVCADVVALVRERHRQLRGLDPRRDAVFGALIIAAEDWRQQVGTNAAPRSEPVSRSPVMTATRAADVLGISDRAVRKACAAGRLDAELVDGQWRITRASVEAYAPRRSTC